MKYHAATCNQAVFVLRVLTYLVIEPYSFNLLIIVDWALFIYTKRTNILYLYRVTVGSHSTYRHNKKNFRFEHIPGKFFCEENSN